MDELLGRWVGVGVGGGCYARSRMPAGWVVVVVGGAGRVGTMWIGCPPLSRARVGTAVCSCAGGCPILCTPMTVRRRWCGERLGDRFLRRRWPTRPAIGRGESSSRSASTTRDGHVRRSFRPTRTRRVRGRWRWRRRCDDLCVWRGAGTVHRGEPARSRPGRSPQVAHLRGGGPVRD